jgi:putative flippase GtrA
MGSFDPVRELTLPDSMVQFVRFVIVGTSGYALNLGVFALAHLAIDYRLAACVSWVFAVTNNFLWNRAWTFRDCREVDAHAQAVRFFVVSLVGLGFSLLILNALVDGAGMPPVLAQAISIICALPLSFAGNKLWSFREAA